MLHLIFTSYLHIRTYLQKTKQDIIKNKNNKFYIEWNLNKKQYKKFKLK